MENKEKNFDEQILDLKKELESLPEDQQELAEKILESYAERSNKTEVIANEIDKYIVDHPDFDPLLVTKRPEDMSYDAYKILRKAGKRSIKEYIKYSKGKRVRLRKG